MIGSVIALVLVIVLYWGLGHKASTTDNSGQSPTVETGSTAPDWTLPSVTTGAPVHFYALGRDRGRPVVLNFFSSTCVPCQKESPLMGRTSAALAARGSPVQFVGVVAADPPSGAVPFLRSAGITYPVAEDADFQVTSGLYGVANIPQTFFINRSGVVVAHTIGAVTQASLEAGIRQITR
jgi:cytochrome c biogenesis protein CcmG/thiol:disulfide interchange protein DsbE